MKTQPELMEVIDRRSQTADTAAAPYEGENPFKDLMATHDWRVTTPPAIETSVLVAPCIYDDPRPRFDHVLISRNETETTWHGTSFIIPETVKKAPNVGVVIAISDFYIVDGKTFPTSDVVNPGDIVTFSNYNAEDLKRDGKEFAMVSVFDLKLIEKRRFAVEASSATGA